VTNLLIAAIGAILASNPPVTVSNLIQTATGIAVSVPATNDPVTQALSRLMQEDDAARAEVEKWVEDNEKFAAQGAGLPPADMRRRILARLAPVREGYEALLRQHTNRADIRIAYASYLGDLGEEIPAIEQLEKARALDPQDPAIWNNLANLYGHNGEVTNAFDYYTRAIELNPQEPVYYHNFGTTLFLFRKDAREHYHINEQQVFDRALALYSNAMRLDPHDFQLAADVAQTFYGIQPPRVDDALRAWTNAFALAGNAEEREGVHLHFARIKIKAGRLEEAQSHLNQVTDTSHEVVKGRLIRMLQQARPAPPTATNASPTGPSHAPTSAP